MPNLDFSTTLEAASMDRNAEFSLFVVRRPALLEALHGQKLLERKRGLKLRDGI